MRRCWPACSRRHLVIGLLALVFGLATVVWIFTFPFHPSLVLRVVPPEATVVSWHLEPAGRMEALLRSAPARILLAAGDVSAGDVLADLAEPGVNALLARLAGTGVALAFAPAYGQRGTPALFLGSWVGGMTTHLARAGWLDRSFEGFTVHRIGRERIWSGTFPDLPPGMQQVSFGVYEGVLAGCASSDPLAALPLLLALRRHGPLATLAEPLAAITAGSGHFRARQTGVTGDMNVWAGTFDLEGDGRLAGHVVLESSDGNLPWFVENAADLSASLRAPCPLPDGLPVAVVALPLARGMTAGAKLLPPGSREKKFLDSLAAIAARDGAICVWVSGGDYAGRLMRLKVPGLGFAVQVDPAMRVETAASRLADTLNSLYGTGLIVVPDRKHDGVQVFRPVKDSGGLAFLGTDERPALALIDGWLVGMSNVALLRRFLAADMNASAHGVMADGLAQVWLRGYLRLPELGEVAGNALAGYALLRLLKTGKAERLDTPLIKRVQAAMDTLGTVRLQAGLDPQGRTTLLFEIDGRQEDAHE